MNLSSYIRIQKFLLATFAVSVAALLLSITLTYFSIRASTITPANTSGNTSPTPESNTVSTNSATGNSANSNINPSTENKDSGFTLVIIGAVSFLTSLTSLLGFISTTVLAWRKEKRDVEGIRIENEKKELELMKLKLELEKIKSEETAAIEKSARKLRKPKKSGN